MKTTKPNLTDLQNTDAISLDDEECKLLVGFKNSRSTLSEGFSNQLADFAKSTDKCSSRQIDLSLSEHDYELIKARALQEGISYEQLLTSVIHEWLHNS